MYRDPWNNDGGNSRPPNQNQTRSPQQTSRPQQPPQPRFDVTRFNEAAQAFFETWRPPEIKRGTVPVPKVLTGFEYSASGFLMGQYANPVSQRIEAWGLDVKEFRDGRLNPRCFKS